MTTPEDRRRAYLATAKLPDDEDLLVALVSLEASFVRNQKLRDLFAHDKARAQEAARQGESLGRVVALLHGLYASTEDGV